VFSGVVRSLQGLAGLVVVAAFGGDTVGAGGDAQRHHRGGVAAAVGAGRIRWCQRAGGGT